MKGTMNFHPKDIPAEDSIITRRKKGRTTLNADNMRILIMRGTFTIRKKLKQNGNMKMTRNSDTCTRMRDSRDLYTLSHLVKEAAGNTVWIGETRTTTVTDM